MIKIIDTIDSAEVLKSYIHFSKVIQWSDFGIKSKQSGIQHKLDEDVWSSSTGKSTGKDLEYNILNPLFKDSIFETLINKYNLKRTRLMWIGPWSCYSMHKDSTPRIHIPLITNPECYFVFLNGTVKHLTTDNVWWVDTRYRHSFMNCSDQNRLHLVGVVEKN